MLVRTVLDGVIDRLEVGSKPYVSKLVPRGARASTPSVACAVQAPAGSPAALEPVACDAEDEVAHEAAEPAGDAGASYNAGYRAGLLAGRVMAAQTRVEAAVAPTANEELRGALEDVDDLNEEANGLARMLADVHEEYDCALEVAIECGWRPSHELNIRSFAYLDAIHDDVDDRGCPTSASVRRVVREYYRQPVVRERSCLDIDDDVFHEQSCQDEDCPGCRRPRWGLRCVPPLEPRPHPHASDMGVWSRREQ